MTTFSMLDARRLAYAALGLALLAAAVLLAASEHAGWSQLAAFGAGPDVALLLGFGSGLAPGRLHPRAVPLYNLLHRFWGPLVVAVLALPLSSAWLVGALAWGVHVALDRAAGYGLRAPDGFQRS